MFKKGDKVKVISERSKAKGEIGTIVEPHGSNYPYFQEEYFVHIPKSWGVHHEYTARFSKDSLEFIETENEKQQHKEEKTISLSVENYLKIDLHLSGEEALDFMNLMQELHEGNMDYLPDLYDRFDYLIDNIHIDLQEKVRRKKS
ncbi:MAG: hypothetical protein ACOC44_16495 [Promethearchaeia archaeon]